MYYVLLLYVYLHVFICVPIRARNNNFLSLGHDVQTYSYLFGHFPNLVSQYRLIQAIILQLDRPQWQSILWNARSSQLFAWKMANGQLLFLAMPIVHVYTCIVLITYK